MTWAFASPATQAEVGPFVTGGDVEEAVIETLKDWLPSYLADGERKHGWEVGSTPEPRGWALTGRDLQKFPSDQLPAIVVMAGGIILTPRKEGMGNGVLTATWGVDVGAIFNAAWGRSSRAHAQLYVRAIQLVLSQRPLGDLAATADWRGEVYDEIDFPSSRTYSAAVASFNIEVRDVAWANGGPPPLVEPPEDPTQPLDPWTPVVETDTEVVNDTQ
jgi:hypothetical protein